MFSNRIRAVSVLAFIAIFSTAIIYKGHPPYPMTMFLICFLMLVISPFLNFRAAYICQKSMFATGVLEAFGLVVHDGLLYETLSVITVLMFIFAERSETPTSEHIHERGPFVVGLEAGRTRGFEIMELDVPDVQGVLADEIETTERKYVDAEMSNNTNMKQYLLGYGTGLARFAK